MSKITSPPVSLTEVAVRPLAGSQATATPLVKPPPTVLRLPAGTLIAGTIAGPDSHGGTQVATRYGTLILEGEADLVPGTRVGLRVEGPPGRGRVILLAPAPGRGAGASQPDTGLSPANPAPTESSAASPTTNEAPTSALGAAVNRTPAPPGVTRSMQASTVNTPGQTPELVRPATLVEATRPVTAIVIPSESKPASTPRTAALPPNALEPQTAPVPQTLRPVLTHSGPPRPAPGHAGSSATRAVLKPGARLTLRVMSIEASDSGGGARSLVRETGQPPSAPASVPAASDSVRQQADGVLIAVVTGRNAAGQPVLRTAFGDLVLDVPAAIARGSTLELEVLEARPGSPAPATATPAAVPDPTDLSRDWSSLTRAVDALQTHAPSVAAQVAETSIPRPGPQLGGTLLFLMSALRLADPVSWIGVRAASILDSRVPELARQVREDFRTLSRIASPSAGGHWRAFFLPVHDGQALQQLRVFTRQQKRNHGDAGDETCAARLVVEVDLSLFGTLQFDGLSHDGRFDLIVRSMRPLPEDLRRDILDIFSNARRTTGLRGELSFQVEDAFHLDPIAEMGHARIGVIA